MDGRHTFFFPFIMLENIGVDLIACYCFSDGLSGAMALDGLSGQGLRRSPHAGFFTSVAGLIFIFPVHSMIIEPRLRALK